MSPAAALVTDVLAAGTLLLQAFSLLLLGLILFRKKTLTWAVPYALPAGLLLSFAAAALTLVYSEAFGFAPCGLCWLERAFMYPLPILTAIALWTRDRGVSKYIIGLSAPGAIIALYHHYLQVGGVSILPCPAAPGAADCAQRFIFEFGYVTFPLMAFTAFVFMILLALIARMRAA
jgi:disulfide bond formation protein DsbB